MKNNMVSKNISIAVIVLYCLTALFVVFNLIFNSELILDNLLTLTLVIGVYAIIIVAFNFSDFLLQFKTFKLLDFVILIVVLIILILISFLWQDNWFGFISTITGVLTVIQASRGSKWTFFWGAINVLFYSIIAFSSSYAGDFVLNAFFNVPMQVIGLYIWSKNYDKTQDVVDKRKLNIIQFVITTISIIIVTLIVFQLMPSINAVLGMDSNPRPLIDAFTTTASLFAQVLMTLRFREQWVLWILINIFSIVMWIVLGDYITATMWGAYLINSVFGLVEWSKQ